MSNTVSPIGRAPRAWSEPVSLYGPHGARKYLNSVERKRALTAMRRLPIDKALFAMTLAWTGARISEVLALTRASLQVEHGVVAIVTLKRRRFCVREVPIPPELIAALDRHFTITSRCLAHCDERLWPFSRTTAWRLIRQVMAAAQIAGRQACPRGLRHSFGVGTLQAGVPINLIQAWLGHASVATTAIYAAACGPEEIAFAELFWRVPAVSANGEIGADGRSGCVCGDDRSQIGHHRGPLSARSRSPPGEGVCHRLAPSHRWTTCHCYS
jgi:integrase/recombinase XerD